MKFKHENIKIIITETYEEMSKIAANYVTKQLVIKSNSVLGLATGSTPKGLYKELVEMYRSKKIDFSEVITFNLDEYYPISKNNLQSYNHYMYEHLFDHINMKAQNIHIPDGETDNVDKTCKEYDETITKAGNIDMQILGIGNNGHIGFNEPNECFKSETHLVELDEETIEANARFFGSTEDVPRKAISLGMKHILQAKRIVLIANGENKAEVLYKMLIDDINPKLPATILKLHQDVTLILDKDVAKKILEMKDNMNFELFPE